jgi:hypothetical protein
MGYRRASPTPHIVTDHRFDPSGSASFRGGAINGSVNATVPLVRLTLDEQWAHLHGVGGIMDLWVPRNQVDEVAAYRIPPHGAIRFHNAGGGFDSIAFWTFTPDRVLAQFQRFGWVVRE